MKQRFFVRPKISSKLFSPALKIEDIYFLKIIVTGALLISASPARSAVSDPTPSLSHNKTIAFAVPVSDIRIDGDLADWPNDLPIYKLREREYIMSPVDANGALFDSSPDINPQFRVGYNLKEQSIYVAIEARDDTLFQQDASTILLETSPDRTQDPTLFYRDYHSEEHESKSGFFDDLFFRHEYINETNIESAVKRVGDITVYEWGFKMSSAQIERIANNLDTRLLFDVGVIDSDNKNDIFPITWSPNPNIDDLSALYGSLTFVSDPANLFQIRGQVIGEDGTPLPGMKICVETTDGSWKNEIITGVQGRFTTWVQPDSFQLTINGIAAADTLKIPIGYNKSHDVSLVAPHFNTAIRPALVSARHDEQPQPFLLIGARYKIGDDPSWAEVDFDDSSWNTFTSDSYEDFEADASRILWIRQRVLADQTAAGEAVVLEQEWGTSDSCNFFLNGSALTNVNIFANSQADVRSTTALSHIQPDLLTIRYVFNEGLNKEGDLRAYNFMVKKANSHYSWLIANKKRENALAFSFTLLPLTLFAIHLITYFFFRKQREHLCFAICMLAMAFMNTPNLGPELGLDLHFSWVVFLLSIQVFTYWLLSFICRFFNIKASRWSHIYSGLLFSNIIALCATLGSTILNAEDLFGTEIINYMERFWVYRQFLTPVAFLIVGMYVFGKNKKKVNEFKPAAIWSFIVGGSLEFFSLYIDDFGFISETIFYSTTYFGMSLIAFTCIHGVRSRFYGSVIITIGITVFFVCSGGTFMSALFGLDSNIHLYFLGNMGLIGAISSQLARRVGDTGRSLQTELERVETLSQINLDQERALRQRMENELEEAHQLQISMLPENLPEHPSAEIAWSMKTATEVGGDYYDYRISDSGKLTLILGDATGHGLQAGTLVTATKSLFQSMIIEEDLAYSVTNMSSSLKSMNFKRLGMALTLVEIDGYELRYCPAGIPPILIYRARHDKVEEGETGGLPLGLTNHNIYKQTKLTLESGDALLMMSDGLAERTNEADEEFGYQRVHDLFHEVAQGTPTEVCRKMAHGGEAWAAGKEQDDDVSFLALRIK